MKRVLARNNLLTCWSCGSSEVDITKDEKNKDFKWSVRCYDCGECTLNVRTEKQARDSWNKAYAIPLA